MHLRPLAESDLETIRLLRNRYREAFFDDREISADAQRRWFDALPQKPVEFYVIEDEGRVVGTVSVTTTTDGKEVGNLLLDASCRGRGLSGVQSRSSHPNRAGTFRV